MANKIIYLKWGDRYNDNHVERLREQVKKNCSVPYEFRTFNYCYAGRDFDRLKHLQNITYRGTGDVEQSVGECDGVLREDLGGMAHFQKALFFKFDTEEFDPEDKLLYIDLDSNINGDLAQFFELDNNKPWIAYDWKSFEENTWQKLYTLRANPLYNSSVILWKPGQCEKVWYDLHNTNSADYRFPVSFYNYGMIDNWLFHRFGPWVYDDKRKNLFNPLPKNLVSENGIIDTMSGTTIEEKIKCLV